MILRPWCPQRVQADADAVASGRVLVLYAGIGEPPARAAAASKVFSDVELERAERFRFARDRCEFLVARAIVRSVLAALLDLAPRQVPFHADAHCKPRLSAAVGCPVDVSITHSAGWVACGFVLGRQIGIDIEPDGPSRHTDLDGLACRVLDPVEWQAFRSLDAAERPGWFFAAWRRKEAVLKAAGTGLSVDPRAVRVIERGADGRVCTLEHVSLQGRAWHVREARLGAGPALALALGGPPSRA